jgi:hypothetical protein
VLRELLFVQSGFFVNTSRIQPNILNVESGRLKMANSKHNAVGIMLGVISECFVIDETMVGPSQAPYPVHKVTIIPFAQEMRRDTSLWGQVFGFTAISGSVSNLGFSFSSRKKADFNPSKCLRHAFYF